LKKRAAVILSSALVALLVGVGVAYATQTFYAGSATTFISLSESGNSTSGVAIRTDNWVVCATGCHVRAWYANSGGTNVGQAYSNGASSVSLGSSGSTFVFSRCNTQSGFGTNSARCWTDW
jgi:hypothetical protein